MSRVKAEGPFPAKNLIENRAEKNKQTNKQTKVSGNRRILLSSLFVPLFFTSYYSFNETALLLNVS